MQVLEGPHDAVEAVYATIEADPRHTDVRLLLDEEIPARQFPQWSMGFRTVDDATLRQVRGYDDFLDKPVSAAARPDAPSRARWLLEWFRTHPV
nr:BLUF domain-containing protein [Clavibacter sp. VKM Ac-2872]